MTISHKELGESHYEDWFECKKHDLTSTIPLNHEENFKNIQIRLLLKQINELVDRQEVDLNNIMIEIDYLNDLK